MLFYLHTLLAIVVSATIDSTNLMLGDQTTLRLQATADAKEKVELPTFTDTIISGIEVVEHTELTKTALADGRVQYTQNWTITSFEDSLYSIPPTPFICGRDTIWSNTLALNVIQPFEMDTTNNLTDIRPNYDVPYWWWGTIRWILLGLGILIILALLGYVGYRIYAHFHPDILPQNKEPERPAEEIALEQLDRIKSEKIWQTGHEKVYHTQLTDVVRTYISRRFMVSSTEKTSDETLRAMKPLLRERPDIYAELEKELRLADLVKFAKWNATPDENEMALHAAYHFVRETTPQQDSQADTEPKNTTQS